MREIARGLSAEQVLLLADAICATFGCVVTDYPGLVSIAAVTNPKIHTVSAYRSPSAAVRYIEDHVLKVAPLSGHNDKFARLVVEVFRDLNPGV